MKLKLLFFLGVLTIGLIACGDEAECSTLDITYTNTTKAILDTNCATSGCHGEGTTNTFEMHNYESALAAVGFGKIVGAINHQEGFLPMPRPDGSDKIDDCSIDQITAWIGAGAPE